MSKKPTTKKTKSRNYTRRPMPPEAIKTWRLEMGLSELDAAERLGIAKHTLRRAERDGTTRCVALACAALMAGLQPYGIEEQ